MEKYINQLIDDIEIIIAQRNSEKESVKDLPSTEDSGDPFGNAETYLYNDRTALDKTLKLSKELLPLPNTLPKELLSKLVNAMDRLLASYNYDPVYPEALNSRAKYKLLYDIWDYKQPIVQSGLISIELCDFELISCPIPGECSWCLDDANEELDDDIEGLEALIENHETTERIKRKAKKFEDFLENAKVNKDNIEGIFNYCNRWCEKCQFTNRCTSFQFEKELDDDADSINQVIGSVGDMLAATISLLQSKMFELGIDYNEVDVEKEDHLERMLFEHEISRKSLGLAKRMTNWFKQNENIFMTRIIELWDIDQEKSVLVNEHVTNIGWHLNLIPIKVERAVGVREAKSELNIDFDREDRNATGKLVLECLNTSINSVTYLYHNFSDREDEILVFLTELSNLREVMKKELPEAESYIRPGLDE